MDDYPSDWYGCEDCSPGSDRSQCHDIGTMNRAMFALGSAIYEISEWKVPYGSETEVMEALVAGKRPQLSNGNPAGRPESRDYSGGIHADNF
ncbi:hypothetical protein B0T10DRAFT_501344 [Thelonectria olida]|uniref:Uncharacterized protein n=1 Tax=Thelonectria olida TaxID=1576542 RepID=A0A9P8VQH2_9HYPO|nr:hypothetical protein B0T10DRAFT_501344 [Thelonectria olida]